MKIPFYKSSSRKGLRLPLRPGVSDLRTMSVSALYRGARVGGDFYDFATAGTSRLLFALLDIAGKRAEALNIAASVQEVFRGAADLFAADDVNEPVALSQLVLEINRMVLAAAGGVRCAPAFLGCFNEAVGTLTYINAGHTPALLKDGQGINVLTPTGLPLGLFTHATHDAQICAMPNAATLLMISRGLVEARSGGEEFGLDRVRDTFAGTQADPQEVCAAILEAVRQFVEDGARRRFLPTRHEVGQDDPLGANDATAVALVHTAAAARATA
jgi:serine phosphatase RsbU (regulator of sigma subunit)